MKNPAIEQWKRGKYTDYPNSINAGAASFAYAFTNENIREYHPLLNYDGRVAVTGSGGEQAFYAIINGAEEVTLIDGCPYAEPMVELKKSAIENLTFDEFKWYWTAKHILDRSVMSDLLCDVSPKTTEFFNYITQNMQDINELLVLPKLIHNDSFDSKQVQYSAFCEYYDNPTRFDELKKGLRGRKINFELAEFAKFGKTLKGKYSTIALSNIFDYYFNKQEFVKISNEIIEKRLDKNGTMQLYYGFGLIDFMEEARGVLKNPEKCRIYYVSKILNRNDIEDSQTKTPIPEERMDTNLNPYFYDDVIIYEK